MIDHYQPFLLPFLKFQRNKITKGIKRYYYYSFEDGLWDLLKNKKIPKGTTILLPDFYCMDVVTNIKSHGWKIKYYPLNESFQITLSSFQKYISESNPSVIIIFNAFGITSNLTTNRQWANGLNEKTIIIEDCVHRLINPESVCIPKNNWFILDSIRKVSPLYGSFLYGTTSGMSFAQTPSRFNLTYVCSSLIVFLLFRFTLNTGHILSSPQLVRFAHKKLLSTHDDIIGDSMLPYRGLPLFSYVHSFFNFNKISTVKYSQVKLYESLLWPIPSKRIFRVKIPSTDFSSLHAYPIGIYGKISNDIYKLLIAHNMLVWEKFPDAPWSKTRSVLFLPLGFHIQSTDIQNICAAVRTI